jgi:hypothetical protein
MIEYVLIAVLVIVGVVIMGPYALRSVNAHFKLWDAGVQDSYSENLKQAPVGAVPNVPLNCKCTNAPGACGSTLAGSQCAANQRSINHSCSIQGCDGQPASSCVLDASCCSDWTNLGCGTVPLGQPPTANNCNYGKQMQLHECGGNDVMQCNPDPTCPLPKCLGIKPSPNAIACPNEPPVSGGLTQNSSYSLVLKKASCSASSSCQYYCPAPYVINSAGTGCTLPTATIPYTVAACVDTSLNKNCQPCNPGYSGPKCKPDTNIGPALTNNCFSAAITSKSQAPLPPCGNPGTPSTPCTITVNF